MRFISALILSPVLAFGQTYSRSELPEPLIPYFERHVSALETQTWSAENTRDQLRSMLGLPEDSRGGDLKPVITGEHQREGFRVQNLHFQSLPGLYVTGNLYLPDGASADEKVPAILYVCGHGKVKIDGVNYGNKVNYHKHGVWFARNGYACLMIDTIQLGEIEGIHHGTYNHGRFWWISLGYTPAGVEAWNSMRALDYLETRPEIDASRFGMTGRSGGGSYSWWTATMDPRVKVVVPVAGITTLRNHILDGCVEGHCDCMFPVNTHRWNYGQFASMIAPRKLLISNTDKDSIFPLDGVVQVHRIARQAYQDQDAAEALGLNIEEGPHKDIQPLRTSAFHWMNRHLKGTELTDVFEIAAADEFEPDELKVFAEIPSDELVTTIDDHFVPVHEPSADVNPENLRKLLQNQSFGAWPETSDANLETISQSSTRGVTLTSYNLKTEIDVNCSLHLVHREGVKPEDLDLVVLNVLSESDWQDFLTHIPTLFPDQFPNAQPDADQISAELSMHQNFEWGMAYFCPRGIGPNLWTSDERKHTHIRRRFALLGQTVDGMRIWDIREAIQQLQTHVSDVPVWVQASGKMAGNAAYASLFAETPPARLDLHEMPVSHKPDGPVVLNALRFTDLPEIVGLAARRSEVRLYTDQPEDWSVSEILAPEGLELREVPKPEEK